MLYAHRTQNFQKMSKALEVQKIESGIIELALEYLDPSKERNNALLDRIPVHPYANDWGKRQYFADAMYHEIFPTKNPELVERCILLFQAIYGMNAGDIISYIVSKIWYSNIFSHENKIVKALSSRYGDRAEACFYAMSVTESQKNGNGFWTGNYKSPEVCMDAFDFADDENVKLVLCAMALNQSALPEKKNIIARLISKSETNPVVEKALDYINGAVSGSPKIGRELLTAVGEGAYFLPELREFFVTHIRYYCNTVANYAVAKIENPDRLLNLIAEVPECIQVSYINQFFNVCKLDNKHLSAYFETLAVKYASMYISAMNTVTDAVDAKNMEEILLKVNPDYVAKQYSLKHKAQLRLANSIGKWFKHGNKVSQYIMGESSFADVKDLLDDTTGTGNWSDMKYADAYGIDDVVKRAIVVISYMNTYNTYYCLRNSFGFEIDKHTDEYIGMFIEQDVESSVILDRLGAVIDNSYKGEDFSLAISKAVADRAEYFAGTDVSKMSVTSRWLYITALGTDDGEKYKQQILSLSGDTSKKIKETLTAVMSIKWHDEIAELLQSKKSGLRELAVSVIERKNDGSFADELKTAFEKEKSGKLASRLAVLVGAGTPETSSSQTAGVDIIANIAKGAKAKKVAWLFEQPYKTVSFRDGSDVPEDYLKALIILYSDMPSIAVNKTAVDIAEKINPDDLNNFTIEVFRRWAGKGATAKTKWVMWFCGVHGGHGMIETLMKYIKEWSEHSRGAIASEAVMAMAVNGSSEALMNVDSMARKFKHRQVKNSANKALNDVAVILGITKEELADRIVPDMGFNDEMCRVFDYGKRQFNVYLTPELEIEIFNGDKKVKNMPKPALSDDKEIAEKSYNDFKVMKKQIKTVVANQKQRLEYALMCDRKWTCENWKNLFVKNPVMHCFAVGLIWGVYSGSELLESFRYMDDGSFTNIDGDEFELPENAEIGLVHPIELTAEQKESWVEQLSDYEITQPFNQLKRACYRPTEQELKDDEITRFEGSSMTDYTLRGKLVKSGWETGCPQDAGFFYEFVRNDVIKCVVNPDGNTVYDGYQTEIEFDGMCIDVMQSETVALGKLVFKNYNAGYSDKKLKIKDVNPRYFSEIIMQLSALGNAE